MEVLASSLPLLLEVPGIGLEAILMIRVLTSATKASRSRNPRRGSAVGERSIASDSRAVWSNEAMDVLGIRTYRDELKWALLRGTNSANAAVVEESTLAIPASAERSEELNWVRKELIGLIDRLSPDAIVIAPAEGATANAALLERSQVDGVVLEACHASGAPVVSRKTASQRSAFGCRNNVELDAILDDVPALKGIGKSSARRQPIVAALTQVASES